MSSQDMANKIINNSDYAELPDVIVTLKLAIWFAKNELRPVPEAMRQCAHEYLKRAKLHYVQRALHSMSKSANPEGEMTDLILRLSVMRNKLATAVKGKHITDADLEDLRKL